MIRATRKNTSQMELSPFQQSLIEIEEILVIRKRKATLRVMTQYDSTQESEGGSS